jgi:hypothetical protein
MCGHAGTIEMIRLGAGVAIPKFAATCGTLLANFGIERTLASL